MKIGYPYKLVLKLLCITIVFLICTQWVKAQPVLPQRTVTAQPTQAIDFGVFYVISAGTITVDWQGTVSTTGGVVSLSTATARPAIFDIKLCEGRNVTITYNPTTTLYNGAEMLNLNVGLLKRGQVVLLFL